MRLQPWRWEAGFVILWMLLSLTLCWCPDVRWAMRQSRGQPGPSASCPLYKTFPRGRRDKGSCEVRGHFLFRSVCSVYAGTGELVQGHTIITHTLPNGLAVGNEQAGWTVTSGWWWSQGKESPRETESFCFRQTCTVVYDWYACFILRSLYKTIKL